MKRLILLITPFVLFACAVGGPALNRDQFVDGMKQYSVKDGFVMQTHVLNENARQIARRIEPRLACYNVHIEKELTGYMDRGRMIRPINNKIIIDYSARIVSKDNKYELTVQRDDNSPGYIKSNPWPEGGIYLLAIDYEPIDQNKTRMTIYQMPKTMGMDVWSNITSPIVDWSMGKNTRCPDFQNLDMI